MNTKIHREDITGKRFARLTVISPFDKKGGMWRWNCLCDCGNHTIGYISKLKNGCKKSCGCLKGENVLPKYGKDHHGWTGYEKISGSYWKQIEQNAKLRGIKFSIKIKPTYDLFLKQNGKCALTGDLMEFPSKQREKSKPNRPSLDRINPNKGYVIGNIQWVIQPINYMKLDYTQDEFIEICKKVAKNNP